MTKTNTTDVSQEPISYCHEVTGLDEYETMAYFTGLWYGIPEPEQHQHDPISTVVRDLCEKRYLNREGRPGEYHMCEFVMRPSMTDISSIDFYTTYSNLMGDANSENINQLHNRFNCNSICINATVKVPYLPLAAHDMWLLGFLARTIVCQLGFDFNVCRVYEIGTILDLEKEKTYVQERDTLSLTPYEHGRGALETTREEELDGRTMVFPTQSLPHLVLNDHVETHYGRKIIGSRNWRKLNSRQRKDRLWKCNTHVQNIKQIYCSIGCVRFDEDMEFFLNHLLVKEDLKDDSNSRSWLFTDTLRPEFAEIIAAPAFPPMNDVIDRISRGERVRPNESMAYEQLRLCSLRTYPEENKPFLIRFAQAGFYYASNGDEVVCYCCEKRISNWKEEDDPMEIHRRVAPTCSFVINNAEVNVNVTPRPYETSDHTHRGAVLAVGSETERPATAEVSNNGAHRNMLAHQMPNIHETTNSNHMTQRCAFAANSEKNLRKDYQMANFQNDKLPTGEHALFVHNQPNTDGGLSPTPTLSISPLGLTEVNADISRHVRSGKFSSGARHNPNTNESGPISVVAQASDSGTEQRDNEISGTRKKQTPRADTPNINPTINADLNQHTQTTGSHSSSQMPKHPRFASDTARLASFSTCSSIALPPERVSEAGLFYAGTADCTRCFHCGIDLRHWSADDDPWVEHAIFSIDCEFVLRKKGEEFVHLIRLALAYTKDSRSGQGTRNDWNALLATDAAQSITEMGYSDDMIKQAISTIIRTRGEAAISGGSIMEQIFNIEDSNTSTTNNVTTQTQQSSETVAAEETEMTGKRSRSGNSDQKTAQTSTAGSVVDRVPAGTNDGATRRQPSSPVKSANKDTHASKSHDPGSAPSDTKLQKRKLKKEIETMKLMSTCSKCKNNDVCIVFLPCGHLITCEDCAPAMRKCCQCGEVIKGNVRTYRS